MPLSMMFKANSSIPIPKPIAERANVKVDLFSSSFLFFSLFTFGIILLFHCLYISFEIFFFLLFVKKSTLTNPNP